MCGTLFLALVFLFASPSVRPSVVMSKACRRGARGGLPLQSFEAKSGGKCSCDAGTKWLLSVDYRLLAVGYFATARCQQQRHWAYTAATPLFAKLNLSAKR